MIKKKSIGKAMAPYWYAEMEETQNDPYCEGCQYYRSLSGMGGRQYACHYILDRRHCRPCDPGKDCTAKIERQPERSE